MPLHIYCLYSSTTRMYFGLVFFLIILLSPLAPLWAVCVSTSEERPLQLMRKMTEKTITCG
jgi:hypothetical protein